MVLSLVVCHQTTEQIASSHSNPSPAGHLNVFLTLLKQIHKAKGITLLWLRYYLCSVLLGDPVHHCGLNFSQAISFGLQLKVVNTLLFRGSLQRCVTITLVPKQAAFSPKKFWASKQLKFFLKFYLKNWNAVTLQLEIVIINSGWHVSNPFL